MCFYVIQIDVMHVFDISVTWMSQHKTVNDLNSSRRICRSLFHWSALIAKYIFIVFMSINDKMQYRMAYQPKAGPTLWPSSLIKAATIELHLPPAALLPHPNVVKWKHVSTTSTFFLLSCSFLVCDVIASWYFDQLSGFNTSRFGAHIMSELSYLKCV